jgi:crotonobetainyl-CoA:carnitine CoA-transferase CaiB-like acyl-CoA transferase
MKPYDGLRVLELEGAAGMYCGKILSFLGAEVIKIESPEGDICRKKGPFKPGVDDTESSLYYAYFNTGKKSITLDISIPQGGEIFKELVKESYVIIESFAPGQLKSWGLDYDTLKEIRPGLIMLSITPFGQSGPHSGWNASSDLIVDAMGGPMADAGIEGKGPLHLGGDIMTAMAGMYGLFAIQAAYHNYLFTNEGTHIDLSQQECFITWKNQSLGFTQVDGKSPGLRKPDAVRQGLVRCKDGFAFVMIGGKWKEVLEWFSDTGQDISVFDNPVYAQHAVEVLTRWDTVLLERFNILGSNYTKTEFMLEGQRRRIPVGVLETPDTLLENEHLKARGYFREVEHPVLGRLLYPGEPVKMSGYSQLTGVPAPLLGEHNKEVYSRLGYSLEQLEDFRQRNII